MNAKEKDGDITEDEEEQQKSENTYTNASMVEDYKNKGLLKDRYFMKYHKEILILL